MANHGSVSTADSGVCYTCLGFAPYNNYPRNIHYLLAIAGGLAWAGPTSSAPDGRKSSLFDEDLIIDGTISRYLLYSSRCGSFSQSEFYKARELHFKRSSCQFGPSRIRTLGRLRSRGPVAEQSPCGSYGSHGHLQREHVQPRYLRQSRRIWPVPRQYLQPGRLSPAVAMVLTGP